MIYVGGLWGGTPPPPGRVSEAPLGSLLGSFYVPLPPLGILGLPLGSLWVAFGRPWAPFGLLWGALGVSWGYFGITLSRLWGTLRVFGGSVGCLWAPLGHLFEYVGDFRVLLTYLCDLVVLCMHPATGNHRKSQKNGHSVNPQ